MIVAIIGRSYSGKRRLVTYLRNASHGRFRPFKQFTTREDFHESRHMYMPKTARDKLEPSRIFYSSFSDKGDEYFSLTTQFINGGNLVYVMDDPLAIARIDELGLPYAVIYVDCSTSVIYKKVRSVSELFHAVLTRFTKVRGRLRRMERSGEYNLYINTSVASQFNQETMIEIFYRNLCEWEAKRDEHELHPKMFKDSADRDWLRKARDIGFLMADM